MEFGRRRQNADRQPVGDKLRTARTSVVSTSWPPIDLPAAQLPSVETRLTDVTSPTPPGQERNAKRDAACLRAAGLLAKLGAWEINVTTSEVFWSDETWTLLAGEPRVIDLDEAMKIYPQNDRARIERLFVHAQTTGEKIFFENEITKFDGSCAWIRVSGEAEFIDGACVALRGAAQDITDFHNVMKASGQIERRLNLAMELADLHVYEVDYRNRTLINQGAEDTFFESGLTYEMLWRDPFFGVHPEDRASAEAAWARSQSEGAPYRAEYRVLRSDGQEVWAFSTAELVKDHEGRPLRLVGVLQNITARKRAECEVIAARDVAEAANHAKSAFLANMSHEIRTPLNGIIAGADMLSRKSLDGPTRKLVEMVESSGATLQRLLSDILDLARIEAGEVTLEISSFHLGETIRSAAALARLKADEKGLSLAINLSPAADCTVDGDPIRTRQVVLNLLSNAVKFTDRGSVTVSAERDAGGQVSITVQDTGVGFDPTASEGIFGRFQQADGSITRRYGGTGLGLAISRQLVELMGGALRATSTLGEGSTFWLELPLPEAGPIYAHQLLGQEGEALARPLRLLLADDHPTNRMVVELLLAGMADIVSVENGQQAVEAYSRQSFDAVLMDMQMPIMDGLTAVRAIRQQERERPAGSTPVIMLTANALPEHVAASLEAGANLHVEKPITLSTLLSALEKVLPVEQDGAVTGTVGQ